MASGQTSDQAEKQTWDVIEYELIDGTVIWARNNHDGTFTVRGEDGAEHTIPFCSHTPEEDERILLAGVYT